MILAQIETWPLALLKYLESQHEVLLAHAQHERATMDAYLVPKKKHTLMSDMPPNPHFRAQETAEEKVSELLQSDMLRGWHCTRLTGHEVEFIRSNGMQPPNPEILQERIQRLQADGILADEIASWLIKENQACEKYRQGMIWFCFFEPWRGEQSGIERFFRRWGGEALYNSHESDPVTGTILQTIGSPCLIEADVPVSSFGRYTFLGRKVIGRWLMSHGFDTHDDLDYEDKARSAIPAANIIRFVHYGESEFESLTRCDKWEPPLG